MHVVAVLPAHWVPDQLVNCALAAGEAARVTVVLFGKDVPEGDWVMVPSPTTAVVRVNFVSEVTPEPTSCAIGPVLDSLSVAESEAARLPVACGMNVTVIEHEAPTGMGAEVQESVSEKSAGFEPAKVNPVITSGAVAEAPF